MGSWQLPLLAVTAVPLVHSRFVINVSSKPEKIDGFVASLFSSERMSLEGS